MELQVEKETGIDLVGGLQRAIAEKSNMNLQKKYLQEWHLLDSEREEFEQLLQFFISMEGRDIDTLAEDYLFLNGMIMEETKYFRRHGTYRNSSFESVENSVYHNPEYMDRYMSGLAISDYLWINHIKMMRYFGDFLKRHSGGRYLEVGPGYGQYLVKAAKEGSFQEMLAVDLSETSVEECKKFVGWKFKMGGHKHPELQIRQMNFFDFSSDERFDCIVMGEVLEHVEDPLGMMKKLRSMLAKGGSAFITTVVNAPAFDHIYLFSEPGEVVQMARDAGFSVCDYLCTTEADAPMEKVRKFKMAITIAMILGE